MTLSGIYAATLALIWAVWLVSALRAAGDAAATRRGLEMRALLALAALTLGAFLLRILHLQPDFLPEGNQGQMHYVDAYNVAQLLPEGMSDTDPLAIAVVMAPLFWFGTLSPLLYQWGNAVLAALTVPALFAVARLLFPERRETAWVAAGILAVWPVHVLYSTQHVQSVGAALFVTTAWAAALAWRRIPGRTLWLLFVASCVLAAASRRESLLLVAPALALWFTPLEEGAARPSRKQAFATAAAVGVLLVPHLLYILGSVGQFAAAGGLVDRILLTTFSAFAAIGFLRIGSALLLPAAERWASPAALVAVAGLWLAAGPLAHGWELFHFWPLPTAAPAHATTYSQIELAALNPKATPLPLIPLLLVGLTVGLRARGAWRWGLVGSWFCLAFFAASIKHTGAIPFLGMRAQVQSIPPAALLVAGGLAETARRLKVRPGFLATAVGLATLLVLPGYRVLLTDTDLTTVQEHRFVRETFATIEPGTVLFPSGTLPGKMQLGVWTNPLIEAAALEVERHLPPMKLELVDELDLAEGPVYYYEGLDCYRNGSRPGLLDACEAGRQRLEMVPVAERVVPMRQYSGEDLPDTAVEEPFVTLRLLRVTAVRADRDKAPATGEDRP